MLWPRQPFVRTVTLPCDASSRLVLFHLSLPSRLLSLTMFMTPRKKRTAAEFDDEVMTPKKVRLA